MEVEIFSLCDAANNTAGKLSILGAFDTINVKELPYVHPHCAIALRMRFLRIEEGDHKIRIDMVDEDGKSLGPKLDGGVKVNIPEGTQSTSVNMCLGINNLKIEKPGNYEINLAIDGRQVNSLPLMVIKQNKEKNQ